MKRYERIIDEICVEVKKEMEHCILDGYNRLHIEKEYGTAWIDVEIHVVPSWLKLTDVQVIVSHEDGHRRSPNLEQAIIACLPDWYNVEEAVMQAA